MSEEGATTAKRPTRIAHKDKPNARQMIFAQLRAKGFTQVEAYRRIYNPRSKTAHAENAACKIEALPAVKAEIARLIAKSEAKALLTINDRYGILAGIAQSPDVAPSDQVAAIREYNRMEPNALAPERSEVSGPGGGPIPLVATSAGSISKKERVGLWREGRKAARAVPVPAEAPAITV